MLEEYDLLPAETPRIQTVHITRLQDLDLETALLTQYNNATELLSSILHDELCPANQRAQVINSVSTILAHITKSQSDLYNAERIKKLEFALVKTVKTLDKDAQDVFFALYEALLAQ